MDRHRFRSIAVLRGGALTVVLAIALPGAQALAQMAAPSIVPFTFAPENPASMSWGGPSKFGIAYGQAQEVTGPPNPNGSNNYAGGGAGLQWVGSLLAVGMQEQRLENEKRPNGVTEFLEQSGASVSLRLGNHFSLGLGQQSSLVQIVDPQSGAYGRAALEDQTGGLTIRLGEWFFLGGTGGRGYLKVRDLTTGIALNTGQDVYKYGAGIRTRGSVIGHLEYYVVDRQKYTDANIAGVRENSRTGVVEFNLGGLLLGYSATHTERDTGFATTDKDTGDIGYAPFKGWTVVGHGEVVTNKYPAGSLYATTTRTLYTLAVTYLFGG